MTFWEEQNSDEKHELTDIKVHEVSLVGKPSNRRSFLLIKSDTPMGSFDKIMEMAKSKVQKSEKGKDFLSAINEAIKENPDLYVQYDRETLKRIQE